MCGSILKSTQRGITLIEMMVVVLIVGILASIAYPSYQDQVQRSRRSDGQSALLEVAQRLERCYTVQNTYQGCVDLPDVSDEGYYAISAGELSDASFELRADAQGAQVADECNALILSHTGRKDAETEGGVSAEDCW